ncbi:MAG: ribonuclease P protein component [Pseudomonadota bacterium]
MAAGYGFPKSRHLLKTDEISSVFSFKRRFSGEHFQVLVKPNQLGYPRLAVVVGKKTESRAVARNYVKRVVREAFRLLQHELGGLDCVVRAHKSFSSTEFLATRQELQQLFASAAKRNSEYET